RDWKVPTGMIGLFLVFWIGGDFRLSMNPTKPIDNVRVRLVQPNIPQTEKYGLAYRARNWQRLIGLSNTNNGFNPTHIIWPQAAPPFLLAREAEALDDVALLTGNDKVLLTGAARVVVNSPTDYHFFNSFYVF